MYLIENYKDNIRLNIKTAPQTWQAIVQRFCSIGI